MTVVVIHQILLGVAELPAEIGRGRVGAAPRLRLASRQRKAVDAQEAVEIRFLCRSCDNFRVTHRCVHINGAELERVNRTNAINPAARAAASNRCGKGNLHRLALDKAEFVYVVKIGVRDFRRGVNNVCFKIVRVFAHNKGTIARAVIGCVENGFGQALLIGAELFGLLLREASGECPVGRGLQTGEADRKNADENKNTDKKNHENR